MVIPASTPPAPAASGGAARHAALDWLRLIATFAIFVFHSGAPYAAGDWHISSTSKSFALTVWNALLLVWAMPLFFTISGASMLFALRRYSVQQFISKRLKRLFIPLLFGVFVVAPPQVYLERLSRKQFEGSLLAFYPHYFNAPYLEIGGAGNFAWMGLHLWYLLMLLILSLTFLPIFLALERNPQAARWHRWIDRPVMILSLAAPIAMIEWPFGNVGLGGWNMFAYPIFFAYGAFIARSQRGIDAVKQVAPLAIALAIFGTALLLKRVYALGAVAYGQYDPSWLAGLHAFAGWCWVVALIGLACRFLESSHPVLKWISELLLPIYILHQTIIVIIAHQIEQAPFGVWEKYFLVLTSSAIVTIAICAIIVRNFPSTRFLFGMEPMEASVIFASTARPEARRSS